VVLEEGDLCRFGCAFTTAFGRAVRALRGWVDGLSEDRPFRVGVSGGMVHAAIGAEMGCGGGVDVLGDLVGAGRVAVAFVPEGLRRVGDDGKIAGSPCPNHNKIKTYTNRARFPASHFSAFLLADRFSERTT